MEYTNDQLYSYLDLPVSASRDEAEARIAQLMREHSNNSSVTTFLAYIRNYFSQDAYDEFRDYVYKELDIDDEYEGEGEGEEYEGENEEYEDENEDENEDEDEDQFQTGYQNQNQNNNATSYEGRQIVRRVININSQYRDLTKYYTSTDFSVDLSEKLKNVVSLHMNSIQIPFTWYTINKYFGSNFFYIKCIAPGMNLGQYDYKIQLPPGNYTTDNLILRLQESLQEYVVTFTDVNFGLTSIAYNSASAKLTIQIDITHVYNETNYEIEFPSQSNYLDYYAAYGENVVKSLPQLLGYADTIYRPFRINSSKHTSPYNATQTYTITETNSFLVVYLYQASDTIGRISEFLAVGSTIYSTIRIQLTLGTFTASDIVRDLENKIQYHLHLNSEYSFLVFRDNVFTISIHINRKKAYNGKNVKSVLLFPEEEQNALLLPIWRGPTSLFQFVNQFNECNNIISENKSLTTIYTINTSPKLLITCSKQHYIHSHVGVVPDGMYTIDEYIAVINRIFDDIKVLSRNEFQFRIENKNNEDQEPAIYSKIAHVIQNENDFTLDFTGSILCSVLNLPTGLITAATTNSSFTFSSNGYRISPSTNKYTVYSTGPENRNVPELVQELPIPTDTELYLDAIDMIDAINLSFKQRNLIGGIDLSETYLSYSSPYPNVGGIINIVLHKKIKVILTTSDYTLQLLDENNTVNTWTRNLGFAFTTYALDESTPITSLVKKPNNQILLTKYNNYFTINALQNSYGIYTDNHDYDVTVRLSLPLLQYYTKETIVKNINLQFARSSLLYGSYINSSGDYTKIRMNVNQVFTSKDYRLVFFDNMNYFTCHQGKSLQNIKWDTTLGWLLGFRNTTQYELLLENQTLNVDGLGLGNVEDTYYQTYVNQPFFIANNIVTIVGDTAINVQLYNYVLLSITDYCQNRINDGVVTVLPAMPSLAKTVAAHRYKCDRLTATSPSASLGAVDGITLKQAYSANAIIQASIKKVSVYEKQNMYSGAPPTDIFAMIPINTSGLTAGAAIVETGSAIRKQRRTYFAPVNLSRLTIQLLTEKNSLLDLNQADWSFSITAEMYV
jgi:hypothetical protein